MSVSTLSGKPVNKYDDLFALSCPMVGPYRELQCLVTMIRLIGTLVFNLKCKLVDVIERSSQNKYDLKFVRLSDSVNDELGILFGNSNWKV